MVSRWVAISGGALVLAVVAAGLAEATFALGHIGSISNDLLHRPQSTVSVAPQSTASPTPNATPMPTASATPIVTPVPTAITPRAVTNAFVRLRQSNTTNSAILADLNGGTTVELLTYQDTQWQQVRYNGLTGYIYRSYLTY